MPADVASDISPRRRRRWLTSLIALVLLVLVGSVIVVVHWMYSPTALASYVSPGVTSSSPLGKTIYIDDMVESRAGHSGLNLNFRSIKPNLRENSAKATIEIFVCTSTNNFDFSVIKAACTSRTPFKSGRSKFGPVSSASNAADRELIVAVTPHAIGTVDLQGVQVRYHQGLRRGDQHTGYEVHVKVTAAN